MISLLFSHVFIIKERNLSYFYSKVILLFTPVASCIGGAFTIPEKSVLKPLSPYEINSYKVKETVCLW